MKTSLLAPVSRKIMEEVACVAAGENVLVLTDPQVSERIPAALAGAAHVLGGIPSILVMPPPAYPGAPLPGPAEQAVQGAEVVLMATSKSIAHAEIFSREKNRRRLISMPGIMEESFLEGAGAMDLKELREITERVSRALEGRRKFSLKSDKGTEASFVSRGKAFSCFSRPPVPAGFTMFPDGESIIALEEKTLEGRVVMDVYQTGVGPLREPICFDLEKGRVLKITGGLEARLLQELLREYGDQNAYCFGEFALGTNPRARFIGSAGEDKKRLGTIHMSLGDDIDIGGELKSRLHLDAVMGRPTVSADGEMLIDDGKLLI